MTLPKYIALCGHPGAGKSLVQQILFDEYQVEMADDGLPLREIAMRYLGLTRDQVFTQLGKSSFIELFGKVWTPRQVLGELGNKFEELFGEDAIPAMALAALPDIGGKSWSFGSVRRNQGAFYQQHGGVVIGIRNPGVKPSPFEFDRFNEDIVDYWIENDFLHRGCTAAEGIRGLTERVHAVIREISREGSA